MGTQAAADGPRDVQKSIFRRRKAKGPNPLSARVSKKQKGKALVGSDQQAAGGKVATDAGQSSGKGKHRARRRRGSGAALAS